MDIKVLNFTNSKTYTEVETGIPMDYYQNVDDNFGNPRTKFEQIILNLLQEREGNYYSHSNSIYQFIWFYWKKKGEETSEV